MVTRRGLGIARADDGIAALPLQIQKGLVGRTGLAGHWLRSPTTVSCKSNLIKDGRQKAHRAIVLASRLAPTHAV